MSSSQLRQPVSSHPVISQLGRLQPERLQLGRSQPGPRRARAAAVALLAAVVLPAAVLAMSGCGEKSLPAATRSIDLPKADVQAISQPSGASLPAANSAHPAASNPNVAKSAANSTGDSAAENLARAEFIARHMPLRDITFDTIKLNMNKGDEFRKTLLTPSIKQLDGKRVRIRGFILPPPQQEGLTQFVLVRDNRACCFGPGAAIYDSMIVKMKPGLSTDYSVLPITVEGTFNIHQIDAPDGHTFAIYRLTADKAQ